jgi:haloalkane dehalogenase
MPQDQQPPSIDQLRAQVSQMLNTLPAAGPISAIVLLEVNPQKEEPFLQIADALTEATRRLPGCNVFAFQKTVQPSGAGIEYLIYEDWQTRDFFRTQWDSNHLQRFQHAVGDLIVAPPDLRFYSGWREYRAGLSAPVSGQGDWPEPSEPSFSSILTLPIAMSLFGLRQMAGILDPGAKTASAFESPGDVTGTGLANPLRVASQFGAAIQKSILDLTGGVLGGQRGDSGAGRDSTSSVVQPASAAVAQPAGKPSMAGGQPISTQPQRPPGWGPMPYPVPTRDPAQNGTPVGSPTPAPTAAPATPSMAEPNISPDYPYADHFVDVLGSRMHYIEQGSGDTILLLHGNPSWSYIWRNIIPHLSSLGRCIAPDLIGYGRSGKPDIEYMWSDHVRYLEGFIDAMNLRNITLVLHDQGSSVGFNYAMHHQHNVHAIAFFEAIVRPYPWDEFSTPEFRELFRRFRTGGIGGEGWQMIVEQNMFIEQLLSQAAGRQLSDREMNFYREPFIQKSSRLPIWRFPKQTPIGGEPQDVWDAVGEYSSRLQRSKLPKLMLYATPGALLTQEHVAWCRQNICNLHSVPIGPGLHFLQESSPHRIGTEIARWYRHLPG